MALVLVIDDEADVRAIMVRTLERRGHQVLQAADGEQGLALARQYRPALVVTDIIMPEKEGIETIKELRADRGAAQPKIIAVSGGGRTKVLDFLKYAREFGADEVLEKPFRPDEFAALVDKVLAS